MTLANAVNFHILVILKKIKLNLNKILRLAKFD